MEQTASREIKRGQTTEGLADCVIRTLNFYLKDSTVGLGEEFVHHAILFPSFLFFFRNLEQKIKI